MTDAPVTQKRRDRLDLARVVVTRLKRGETVADVASDLQISRGLVRYLNNPLVLAQRKARLDEALELQREIASRLKQGQTRIQIADDLGIGLKVVDAHRSGDVAGLIRGRKPGAAAAARSARELNGALMVELLETIAAGALSERDLAFIKNMHRLLERTNGKPRVAAEWVQTIQAIAARQGVRVKTFSDIDFDRFSKGRERGE